jgi:rubrerythrin
VSADLQPAGTAEDGAYVEFWQTGTMAKGEFSCSECGYGVIVARELPPCPMCGGESWEQAGWAPFARATAAALS